MATSPPSPTVAGAIAHLGPKLLEPGHVAPYSRSVTPLAAVTYAAAINDTAFFSTLPPMLLHDHHRVTANKLYGGTEASKIADAAYRAGPFGEAKGSVSVITALLFDLNSRSLPAVLYRTTDFRGEEAYVLHVYDAPLSELEADMFDDRKPISKLERSWLGEDTATSSKNMRMHMGALLREGGLATMPGFLLSGDYHLVRGALPWLHLRAPTSSSEIATCTDAMLAVLAYDPNVNEQPVTFIPPLEVLRSHCPSTAKLVTVFDRCKAKYHWVPERVTEEKIADGKNPGWKPFFDRMTANREELSTRSTMDMSGGLRDALTLFAALLLRSQVDCCQTAVLFPSLEYEDEDASDMSSSTPLRTLHTLTAGIRTAGVISPTRLGSASMAPNSLEKVASATFAASDAVLAFRDVDGWVHRSRDESVHDAIEWCTRMAGRISEPLAMLIIDLDYAYGIKSARLVNSALVKEFKDERDRAEMLRLMICPWVTVVLHRTALDLDAGWFTLDCSLVKRDLLTVTDKVRETFGAAPARPPKPAATPESVDQLRKDLWERLDKMDKAIGEAKTVRQAPPRAAPTVATPPESATMVSLRAATEVLERLTGKKRAVENGAR